MSNNIISQDARWPCMRYYLFIFITKLFHTVQYKSVPLCAILQSFMIRGPNAAIYCSLWILNQHGNKKMCLFKFGWTNIYSYYNFRLLVFDDNLLHCLCCPVFIGGQYWSLLLHESHNLLLSIRSQSVLLLC